MANSCCTQKKIVVKLSVCDKLIVCVKLKPVNSVFHNNTTMKH